MQIKNFTTFATRNVEGAFQVVGNATYSTNHHGTYLEGCCRINGNGSAPAAIKFRGINTVGQHNQGLDLATQETWFYVLPATAPSASEPIYQVVDAMGAVKLELRMTSARKLQLWNAAGAQVGSDSPNAFGTTYPTRIQVKCGTGASAAYEIYVEDLGGLYWTGTTNLGTGNVDHVVIGQGTVRNGSGYDIYVTAVAVYDSNEPDVVGSTIVGGRLDANSTEGGGWSPATAHPEIDDWGSGAQDEDSSFIYSTSSDGADAEELIGLEAVEDIGFNLTICAVKIIARMRDNTGTTRVVLGVDSGGTQVGNDQVDLSATYSNYCKILEKDPATGENWTYEGVNALKVKLKNNSSPHVEARCTAICAEIFGTAYPSAGKKSPMGTGPKA